MYVSYYLRISNLQQWNIFFSKKPVYFYKQAMFGSGTPGLCIAKFFKTAPKYFMHGKN